MTSRMANRLSCGLRLYLSGPMTGIERHNFPAFNAAAAALRSVGYDVFNPAERGIVEAWEWADYLLDDLAELRTCHGVARLPGCDGSAGARVEREFALGLKLTIGEVDEWLR